jgi:hypothetical protein
MFAMTVVTDGGLSHPVHHGGAMDASEVRPGLLSVTLATGLGNILSINGRLGVVGPPKVMTLMAIIACGRLLSRCYGSSVHTLLVQLVCLGNRDMAPLHQGPVGMAATARLGRAGAKCRRLWIQVAAKTMGLAVAIKAE